MKETVGIKFKDNGRTYFFSTNNIELKMGDYVVVETEKGLQFGKVATEITMIDLNKLSSPLKDVIRKATKNDIKSNETNIKDAREATKKANEIIEEMQLSMRIIDANYLFDRKQLVFNFIADGRVDFRELAKKLASLYKTRIELRQIGVRDKAKEVGGLGPCGRYLCCNTFLTEFDSVSINMAKNQYLSLNPTKINGVCGRLLCCLKYEDDTYTDLKQDFPAIGKKVETPDGPAKVLSVNVFRNAIEVEYPNHSTAFINKDNIK